MTPKVIIIKATIPITVLGTRTLGAEEVQRRACWHLWDFSFYCLLPPLIASSSLCMPGLSSSVVPGVALVVPSSAQCAVTAPLEAAGC